MSRLEDMKQRFQIAGGDADGRNVKSKLKSMQSALLNSYQAEWITFKDKKCRCLINPDKLTTNYDQKEISIEFDYDMHEGDTFYWDRTGHYWMAYLQKYEEEAYFRAELRRCDFEINGYPIYLRGPVETALVWRQKHQIEMNELNYSIMFYITKNEENLEFFSRFKVFKFEGHNWRVAATDKFSQPGLIEVYAEEYFDNEMEDAMIIPEIVEPNLTKPYIDGPQFVRPFDTNISYSVVNGKAGGTFVVNSSNVKIISTTDSSCLLEIMTGKSTKFNLTYKVDGEDDILLDITVKTL